MNRVWETLLRWIWGPGEPELDDAPPTELEELRADVEALEGRLSALEGTTTSRAEHDLVEAVSRQMALLEEQLQRNRSYARERRKKLERHVDLLEEQTAALRGQLEALRSLVPTFLK